METSGRPGRSLPQGQIGHFLGADTQQDEREGGPEKPGEEPAHRGQGTDPQAGETLLEVGMEVGHVLSAGTLCVRIKCGILAPIGS